MRDFGLARRLFELLHKQRHGFLDLPNNAGNFRRQGQGAGLLPLSAPGHPTVWTICDQSQATRRKVHVGCEAVRLYPPARRRREFGLSNVFSVDTPDENIFRHFHDREPDRDGADINHGWMLRRPKTDEMIKQKSSSMWRYASR